MSTYDSISLGKKFLQLSTTRNRKKLKEKNTELRIICQDSSFIDLTKREAITFEFVQCLLTKVEKNNFHTFAVKNMLRFSERHIVK